MNIKRIGIIIITTCVFWNIKVFSGDIIIPQENLEMGKYDLSKSGIRNKKVDVIGSIKDLDKTFNDELSNDKTYSALKNLIPEKKILFRGIKESNIYKQTSHGVVLVITNDGIGSGTLISNNGEILTNWHVVRDQKEVGIIFKPKTEGTKITQADMKRAKILRYDEIADLALLKVQTIPNGIIPIKLGDIKEVIVGADVHAIGHPTGESWTYTKGVISQIRKDYEWSSLPTRMLHKADVIQTQTPINPGNSGGPLLSDDSKIIGVNSFKSEGEGLNFAVGIEEINRFISSTSNRYSKSVQETQKIDAKICEPKEIYSGPHSTIKNVHVSLIDIDCDDKAEIEIIIPEDKSKPALVKVDKNKDGRIDIAIFDYDRDGKWDFSFHDVDYDGKWDLVGYHPDGKLLASSFEPYEIFMAKSK